jgi:hypothetical protein
MVVLYVSLFTALLAGAAAAAEWGAQGRIPARHFWTAAIVFALAVPPVIVATRTHRTRAAMTAVAGETFTFYVADAATHTLRTTRPFVARTTPGTVAGVVRRAVMRVLPSASPRAMRAIAAGWMIASLALVAWIIVGVLHWRRERRAWTHATVDGIPVDVSPSTGPAVLGVLSQRIVLPAWATSMAPEYRTLMLAHECEHIRARDPQRLALALGALVLMPWNLALWWCAARLRRAIELDCDARVLRAHPSPKAYGYLLLEVASRGRNTGALAMPLVGLLRLPSELETRLRAMTRPRTLARRTLLIASALTLGALGGAYVTPVPRALALGNGASATVSITHAAPQRNTVYVGSAKLMLDGATFSPKSGTMTGKLVRFSLDTVPERSRDSIAKLNRKVDSLTAQLHRMEADGAKHFGVVVIDSARMAELRARQMMIANDSVRLGPGERRTFTITVDRDSTHPERRALMRVRDEEAMRRSAARLDSLVAKAAPDLAAHPDRNLAVWIVTDSSGRIVHSTRTRLGADGAIGTATVTQQFPDVSAGDIESIEVRKNTPAAAGAVIWIRLKK